jgi:hypothetical protein
MESTFVERGGFMDRGQETVDASSIFRAVLNRRSRLARENGQLNAAIAMCDAIKAFKDHPNRNSLQKFAEAESRWLSIVGPNRNKSYADELGALLRQGKLISITAKTINSAHNDKYDPPYGYVYGMTSMRYPRLIKLGVTSRKRHPQDRWKELSEKYSLTDLKISFFCEIAFPARAEREWTLRFDIRRESLQNYESREWFKFEPAEAHTAVSSIVKDLGLKEYGRWYLSKEIRDGITYSKTPSTRNAPLGTLAKTLSDQ